MTFDRRRFLQAALLAGVSGSAHAGSNGPMPIAGALRCEYAENPLGIDLPDPRLDWQIESPREGERQTAYQVLVARTEETLRSGQGDLWDSGKVDSNSTAQIAYGGVSLRSRQRCYWKVRFWDSAGEASAWSQPASWEMGLLEAADWKARWIKASRIENQADPVTGPAPWFRREFNVPATVNAARAYICGLGFSELYLNGNRVGDHVLSPNQTDFDIRRLGKLLYPFDDQTTKRVLYVIHDVTRYLKPGQNAIGVVLGNGWYNQRDRIVEALSWYGPPRLLLQLEAECAGGARVLVTSAGDWKVSTGPILHDGIFTGETYDARLEMLGWSEPGFDDAAWTEALPAPAPKGALRAQIAPADRITRRFHPVSMSEVRPGVFSYDAGENLAGWARVTFNGPRGRQVTLRFLEELGPDYHQADHYHLKGGGRESWEPRFTWHGFRHMEVIGAPRAPALSDVEFCSVHSDVAEAGRFECSNPLLTRLFENFRRTQLANMHCGVPSDCPHRERLGYTGDGQIASEAAIFALDMAAFYTKWTGDIADSQNRQTGFVPHSAPFGGGAGGYAWGSAIVILPWRLYLYFGDRRILEQSYQAMVRWVGYCSAKVDKDGILTTEEPSHVWIGDWSAPLKMMAPAELVNTAYYAYCALKLGAIAAILGRREDAERFQTLGRQVAQAIDGRFFSEAKHQYAEGTHGCNFFALGLGIVPRERVPAVLERGIALLMEDAHGHFDTGFIGTPLVLKVLARHRRDDVAYQLMTRTDFPSYGDAIARGATTIWENWNRGSHSHPMFGAACAWLFRALAGINPDSARPGFRHIRFRPAFLSELAYVRATYRSIAGVISSELVHKDGLFDLNVRVPAGAVATVTLASGENKRVGSGEHRFKVRV